MVELTISDIRQALWLEYQGPQATRAAATAQTGRIFHEVFAELMGGGTGTWQAALDAGTIGDAGVLLRHVYDRLLGPRLHQQQASLAESGEQVWKLWRAVREMTEWTSGLLHDAARDGRLLYDPGTGSWQSSEPLCVVEERLEWTLTQPGWSATVRVSGVPDAVWRNPRTGRWCVVEYKVGDAAPPVDLAQACLYHQMLSSSGVSGDGAVAVVAFHPERKETFFSSEQLEPVRDMLVDLIGKLAGVSGSDARPPALPPPPPAEEHHELGKRIVSVLSQFNANVQLTGTPVVGPSFIRFPIMPARGVRVTQVTRCAEELQLRLQVEQPPMIHNHQGRLVVDVARRVPEPVLFSSILDKLPKPNRTGSAAMPIGVDLEGRLQMADLSKSTCPHLLVAGTAGSGKSEWLRTAIAGLIVSNTPETCQLVAIDPKYNAFGDLEGGPYLWRGKGIIHPTEHSVAELLDELIEEMEDRYRRFKSAGADDLAAYVDLRGVATPRIFCFCDEYFDLIADRSAKREIEPRIARLASKARACGIHLVLATQYPKAEVVTGVIRANLSGKVCLRVTEARQSQVILGQAGGEKLLGKGDLLFLDIGEPVRLQAPFLPGPERERIFGAGREDPASSRLNAQPA